MATIELTRGDASQQPASVDVSDILPDVLAKAWFTVKRRLVDTDAQAVIQKTITASLTVAGQIDQVGATNIDATMFFLLTAADTEALSDKVLYHYSIKALSSGGAAMTVDTGRLSATPEVTEASS